MESQPESEWAAAAESEEERQQRHLKLKPLRKEVEQAEAEIEKLETRKKELELLMADPNLYQDQDKFAEAGKEYNSLGRKLERLYQRWEEIQGQIETTEAEFEGLLWLCGCPLKAWIAESGVNRCLLETQRMCWLPHAKSLRYAGRMPLLQKYVSVDSQAANSL